MFSVDSVLACLRKSQAVEARPVSDFLAECARAEALLKEDMIQEAFELVQCLERSCSEEDEVQCMALADFAGCFHQIKQEFHLVCTVLEHASNQDKDWCLAKASHGIETHFRYKESEGHVVRENKKILRSLMSWLRRFD